MGAPATADQFARPPGDVDLYPGTNRQLVTARALPLDPPASKHERWDTLPRKYSVRGRTVEFFTIGALAKALNRKTATIRAWETNGTIPVSLWRSPSEDYRGKQRLYSRDLIEAIVEIAREEGVLDPQTRNIHNSQFRERVYELFVRIASSETQASGRPA